jgi:hypothetical protein
MTTAYTSLLGLALPVQGELSGTWGDVVNNSITSLVDTAVAGTTNVSTDGNVTLTTTTGASNQARQAILLFSGARTAIRTVTAPAQSKIYTVINATTGGYAVQLVGAGPTTGVTIANGSSTTVAWNGSDFVEVSSPSSIILPNGTANGVLYLNGSKVVTSGTALSFDGSNLGLGVTPSAWATLRALQIGNGAAIASAYNSAYIYANAFFNGTNAIYLSTNKAVSYTMDAVNGSHAWNIAASGTAGNAITFTQAMTLDASGNLLVGTTSASGKVTSVTSGVTAGSFTGASAAAPGTSGFWNNYVAGLDLYDSAGGSGYGVGIRFRPNNGGTYPVAGIASLAPSTTTSALVFHTQDGNGSVPERARIDSSGRLLVGGTSATSKITLNQTSQNTYGEGFSFYFSGSSYWTIVNGSGNGLYFGFNGADRATINSSTGAYTALSDKRLKKNITDIQYGLNEVLSLRSVSYNMNEQEDGDTKALGFIAQEALEVIPESVTEMMSGMYGMDKVALVPVLVKAIQEQQAIIESLKARLDAANL